MVNKGNFFYQVLETIGLIISMLFVDQEDTLIQLKVKVTYKLNIYK